MKYIFSTKTPKDSDIARVVFIEGADMVVRGANGKMVIEVGIGSREAMTLRKLITTIRKMIAAATAAKQSKLAIDWTALQFPQLALSSAQLAELVAVNCEMANFAYTKYKTKPKDGWNAVSELTLVCAATKEVEMGIKKGKIIGEGVNATRALANTPGGDMTPALLAEEATQLAQGLPIEVTVYDEHAMKELGMGAILAVGKGSHAKPRFIRMEYRGGDREAQPIVLVGKGITFDTGGLNLKPSDAIYEMHMDMSGGAAVIHAIIIAARLKLKSNIVALVPAAENMPSGESYRPGDVIRSMSGKTIEVLNTDAEGRVVLADALHYAKQFKPALVVDVATLTGAALIALGNKASALFTKDTLLEERFRAIGEATGDYVWPLPLWDEYEADIKGTFGDWANLGKGRLAGAISGAIFLYQFTKEGKKDAPVYPWVHIDIAPRMTTCEGDYLAKGAAGEPVRLLVRLLETFEKNTP